MSWIGGSLSSLTGQLSNLTKDILTEGTEEVSDHATELRVAQQKLTELDGVCFNQKTENERLRSLVRELEEKAESSELQINSISREYRTLLEQREKEIKLLKQQHHENQELNSSFLGDGHGRHDNFNPAVLQLSSTGFEGTGFQQDDLDFGDNITMQHEINRLRSDVQKLQSECRHWKGLAQRNTDPISTGEDQHSPFLEKEDSGRGTEDKTRGDSSTSDLQKQIQDLQKQLHQEKDQRQHELSSLQDAHTQKTSALRRKHKQEVEQLKQQVAELEDWNVSQDDDQSVGKLQDQIGELEGEKEEYLRQISHLTEKIQEQTDELAVSNAQVLHLESQLKVAKEEIDRLLNDHEQVGRDLYDVKQQLLDQLDANHADALGVLSDLREVRQTMDTGALERRSKLLHEKDSIVSEIISAGQQKRLLSGTVKDLEFEQRKLSSATDELVMELGETQHQKLTADIIDGIEKENTMLKKRNVGLQEQITLLEKAVQSLMQERQQLETRRVWDSQSFSGEGLPAGLEAVESYSDTMSFTSDLSDLSRRNQELDLQVYELKSQIKRYASEIETFELMQSDWQIEKEALEDVLMQLREQMKEKENSLNVVEAQKGLAEVVKNGRTNKRVRPSARDSKGLMAVEKQEHADDSSTPEASEADNDSNDDITTDVIKLDKKVGLLMDANARLESQRDRLLREKRDLKRELDELRADEVTRSTAVETAMSPVEGGDGCGTALAQLKEKEAAVEVLTAEKEALEKKLEAAASLQGQLAQCQEALEELRQDQEALSMENRGLYEQLRSREEQLSGTSSRVSVTSSRDSVSESTSRVITLTELLKTKEEQLTNMTMERDEMESSLDELDSQHQAAMKQIIGMRDSLHQANDSLKQKLELSESECHNLRTELSQLSRQQMVNQTDESSTSNELNHQIAALKEDNSNLQERLEQSCSSVTKLEKDLAERNKTLKDMQERLRTSANALNELHMDKGELENALAQQKGQNSELSKKVREMRQKSGENLQRQKSPFEQIASEESGELKQKVRDLERNVAKISKDLNAKTQECSELKSTIETQTVDLEKTASKNQECERKLLELTDEITSCKQELETKTSESSALKEELDKLRKEYDSLTESKAKECSELKSRIETQTVDLEKMASKNQECESKLSELTDEIASCKQELETKTSESSALKEELDKLQSEYDSLTESKAKECSELKSRIETQTVDLEKTASKNQECESKLSELTDEIASCKQELETKTSESSALKEELDKLQSEYDSLAESSTKKEVELETAHKTLEETLKEVDTLKEKIFVITNENQSLKIDSEKLRNDLDVLKSDFDEKVNALEMLNNQLETLNGELFKARKEKEKSVLECENISSEAQTLTSDLEKANIELSEKATEITDLSNRVQALESDLSESRWTKASLEEDIVRLKSEKSSLETKHKHDEETILNQHSSQCQEFEKQIESLKFEKDSLNKELAGLEDKLESRSKQYESYIEELKSNRELDASSVQEQHNQLMEDAHKKELEISELQSQVRGLQEQLADTRELLETTEASLRQSTDQVQEKEAELVSLKQDHGSLAHSRELLEELLRQKDAQMEGYQQQEQELSTAKREISGLKAEVSQLQQERQAERDQVAQDADFKLGVVTELEIELAQTRADIESLQQQVQEHQDAGEERDSVRQQCKELENRLGQVELEKEKLKQSVQQTEEIQKEKEVVMARVRELETEVQHYQEKVKEDEAGISFLNEKRNEELQKLQSGEEKMKSQESMIEVLRQTGEQKDLEIGNLQRKLHRAKSFIKEEQHKLVDADEDVIKPDYSLPALEYKEKGAIELVEVRETVQPLGSEVQSITGHQQTSESPVQNEEIDDISRQIDDLRNQLSEKDGVISELQRNNSSLLKMLEGRSKSVHGDATLVEMHKLENEIRTLKLEREQMMDVMNEKSRESSNLKTETHRLMQIVSAQKTALEKLQKDNQEILQKQEEDGGNRLDDMQKETIQNLSRMIRDKDLEIESLQQKSQTLLSVLQESSQEGNQINSLMQDKENLSKQLTALQQEREQMVVYVNQKHQESVAYHNEVQRLTAYITKETAGKEQLQQEYEKLVPQFEDKKQALLKAQNELINYKQKYTELEVRYGGLVQRSNSEETVDKAMFDSKIEEHQRLQERYKELMDSMREKEQKIQNLHQNVGELEQTLSLVSSERTTLKKQVDHLSFQLQGLQTEESELREEIAGLSKQRTELVSELQLLKEANNKLTLQLQDRDFEARSLSEKTATLTAILQEQQGEKGQLDHMIQENEATQKHIKNITQERDQALLALTQKQADMAELDIQVSSLKDREEKLHRELDRLRQHLVQIEDGYTQEALAAEEREKELRNRLAVAEERALTSSSAVENASQQASQQVESLQQQLHFVATQRDQAYLQISTLQEQNQMYTASMTNLQMVLEQFQQEKENMVAQETEHLTAELETLRKENKEMQASYSQMKEQLEEAADGLEAAARLSEQLDRKEETIEALKDEVLSREAVLKALEEETQKLRYRTEDRVDKQVIRNLILGYFTTPQDKRSDVLRTIGGVLLFTQDDFDKIEGQQKGWVPGFLRFGGKKTGSSPPTSPVRRSTIGASSPKPARGDNSFSEMFVKFLERESSPPPPAVRLPAEEMVRDVQKQKEAHKPAYNPFTAPRHVAMPTQVPISGAHSSHILIGSSASMDQTLPTFAAPSDRSRTPPGSGRSTPASTSAGAILKDVLKTR